MEPKKVIIVLDENFEHTPSRTKPLDGKKFEELKAKHGFTKLKDYDEENKQFLADRYIMGTCPNCGFENAYGDQCEKCGSALSPTDLINPRSTISGNKPVLKQTSHWYLPMQDHEKWLKLIMQKLLLI